MANADVGAPVPRVGDEVIVASHEATIELKLVPGLFGHRYATGCVVCGAAHTC